MLSPASTRMPLATGVGGAIRSAEMCVRAIVDGHAELKEIVIGLYVEGQIFVGDVVVAQSLAPRVKLTNDAVVVGICAGIVAGPEFDFNHAENIDPPVGREGETCFAGKFIGRISNFALLGRSGVE